MKILHRLASFRGESQFTTWAQKIAVRVALTELCRRRWQDVSLEDLKPPEMETEPIELADPAPLPEQQVTRSTIMQLVQRLMMEELTDRQRQALQAVMVNGLPLEEVARRMGTNRNALYKLLHDARQRLQKGLAAQGLTADDGVASQRGHFQPSIMPRLTRYFIKTALIYLATALLLGLLRNRALGLSQN